MALNDKLLRVLITGGTLTPNLLATLSACTIRKCAEGGGGGGGFHTKGVILDLCTIVHILAYNDRGSGLKCAVILG